MSIDNRYAVLGRLDIDSNNFYKLYNIDNHKFLVIKDIELKNYNIVNGRVSSWDDGWRNFEENRYLMTIRSKVKESEVIDYILSNKAIAKDEAKSDIWRVSSDIRSNYALIGKSMEYALGMNFYGKLKLIHLDVLYSMLSRDLCDMIISSDFVKNASIQVNRRTLDRCLKDLTNNFKEHKIRESKDETKVLKMNTLSTLTGCNYVVGTNGKVYIKDREVETHINIRNFPHKHFMIAGSDMDTSNHFCIKSVKLDNNVEVIDKYALANLNMFEEVEIVLPFTLKSIKSYAFASTHAKSLDLKRCRELKEIGPYAFSQSSLVEIEIPETVEKLGEGVFYYCHDLKCIIFSNKCDYFQPNWTVGCSGLEYLILPLTKMVGWNKRERLGIINLRSLKEIWTSAENAWIANEMAELQYNEQVRISKYHTKMMNVSEPKKVKVVIVKRKK